MLVRYEDLSLNTMAKTKEIFEFLKLPWLKLMEEYIMSHTKGLVKGEKQRKESRDPFGTVRNSTASVLSWTRSMTRENVTRVQDSCANMMSLLGYKPLIVNMTSSPQLDNVMVLGDQWHL